MKIIVGLGNPGEDYKETRHNIGFMVVDKLARSSFRKSKSGLLEYSWLGSELELIKPQTFMNKSGEAVKYAMGKHKVSLNDLLVIHDDLDITLGEYKIDFGKGPKVHNGINSVIEKLGSDQFWRVRVGIENRGELKIPGEKYVLGKFVAEEKEIIDGVISKIIAEINKGTSEKD